VPARMCTRTCHCHAVDRCILPRQISVTCLLPNSRTLRVVAVSLTIIFTVFTRTNFLDVWRPEERILCIRQVAAVLSLAV